MESSSRAAGSGRNVAPRRCAVTATRDACSAHGECIELAPEVFELDDVARVTGTGPDELMLAVAEACPATAIRVVDTAVGEQVYP